MLCCFHFHFQFHFVNVRVATFGIRNTNSRNFTIMRLQQWTTTTLHSIVVVLVIHGDFCHQRYIRTEAGDTKLLAVYKENKHLPLLRCRLCSWAQSCLT